LNKENEEKKTNHNVSLVSSHSDNEYDDGPLLGCDDNGSAISEIYRKREDMDSRLRYKPRPGETVVYEEIYIPDADADRG